MKLNKYIGIKYKDIDNKGKDLYFINTQFIKRSRKDLLNIMRVYTRFLSNVNYNFYYKNIIQPEIHPVSFTNKKLRKAMKRLKTGTATHQPILFNLYKQFRRL